MSSWFSGCCCWVDDGNHGRWRFLFWSTANQIDDSLFVESRNFREKPGSVLPKQFP